MNLDQPAVPDAIAAPRRWIPRDRVEYARESYEIMVKHGSVDGSRNYQHRWQARWKAQYLIKLIVDLELAQRWQLAEHTSRRGDGWMWSVEYTRRRHG